MREKIAKMIPTNCDACEQPTCGFGTWDYPCELQLVRATSILTLISEEIEKVENPHKPHPVMLHDGFQYCAFEDCRQEILSLLKE